MPKKITLEEVRQEFENNKYTLLANEYTNNRSKLNYICSNKHYGQISFAVFKKGGRCKQCANEKLRKDRNLSYEFVKQFFKENNCYLLEDKYINNITKMRFICKCGRENITTYAQFKISKQCNLCAIE